MFLFLFTVFLSCFGGTNLEEINKPVKCCINFKFKSNLDVAKDIDDVHIIKVDHAIITEQD